MRELDYSLDLGKQNLRVVVNSENEMLFDRKRLTVIGLEVDLAKSLLFAISIKITELTIYYINRANL